MRVVSVNVGKPQLVNWRGQQVLTSIFKSPVHGRVAVRTLNLDGDEQSDLKVHGGVHKAVYAYPSEHYPHWQDEFPEMELPWGTFGENLTTEGLDETSLHLGDLLRAGTAVLRVTQPRMPCYKLGIRFGRKEVIEKFWNGKRSGFYFSVVEQGEVAAGDTIEILARDPHRVSVAGLNGLYQKEAPERRRIERVLSVVALPESWRKYFDDLLTGLA